ncbi:MAG: hypothetical protein ACI4JZ_05435 [Oscillospiraceae bacterium]
MASQKPKNYCNIAAAVLANSVLFASSSCSRMACPVRKNVGVAQDYLVQNRFQ